MDLERIYYTKPSITQLEINYATDAATNGWGENCYAYIERFEQGFAEHLQVKHAIATSSCTGALHLGMAALGIGPGDQVIMGDINWIASAAPILHLGAQPVLVDVLADSWCLDPDAVEAAINPQTKAILAVHLYGNLCQMDALLALGKKYNLHVIEDAAEAIGSSWKGHPAGSLGTFGTFSFHGTKTLTTGEGGMLVTQDAQLYDKVLTLSNHGRSKAQKKQFWPDTLGFKYKMSNLEAAIGCAQLERVSELIAAKRAIFEYYAAGLRELPVTMNPEPIHTQNGYWMPTVVVDPHIPFNRDRLLQHFHDQQIDSRVFFWPLSLLPMFIPQPEHKVSYSVYSRAINLPSYHDLREADMERVIQILHSHLLAEN